MKVKGILILMVVLAAAPAWGQYYRSMPNSDDQPKITVSGSAVVNVKPDKVILSFGIETLDEDIMTAKNDNNTMLKKALASVKGLGIPAKEIQTDHLSVSPRYDSSIHRRLLGYEVRNTFVVTLTDPSKVEPLVTQMLKDGVNYIHGIDFQTTEFKKYREQAREMALKAAKEKAEKMAAVLDQKIGAPLQISENTYYGSGRYFSAWSWWGGGRNMAMAQNVMQNIPSDGEEIDGTIALGKIAITAQVNVTFRLKSEGEPGHYRHAPYPAPPVAPPATYNTYPNTGPAPAPPQPVVPSTMPNPTSGSTPVVPPADVYPNSGYYPGVPSTR